MERAAEPSRPLSLTAVPGWTDEHDVIVVGHGGAGACAAIEAARAGADTLVLERMSRGGGTTALSTGVVYFGGGTRIQKACGFDDDPEGEVWPLCGTDGKRAQTELNGTILR